MSIYAINGSPRKNKNTATLLEHALAGAKESHPEKTTELIHLYDLNYSGCKSCFACKRIGAKSYGSCAIKDDLHPILEKLAQADAIIFGSPIYFGCITGALQSFYERLLFQYLVYDKNLSTIAPTKMPTACFYTMNMDEASMPRINYPDAFIGMERVIGKIFTPPHRLIANNTYQFDDYSKFESSLFDEEVKRAHRETQFPLDCQAAFDLGKKLLG